MTVVEFITGPNGGIVAMAFGTGCGVGYGFAMRTALAGANRRIAELQAEAKEWREKYLSRLEM